MGAAEAEAADKCPVDHDTREKWLEAARSKASPNTTQPNAHPPTRQHSPSHFSLDTGRWESFPRARLTAQQRRPRMRPLSTDREISTIPRASDAAYAKLPNAAERAAMATRPANNEADTGHDSDSGNWVYPSQEMFFNAMRRKGHAAQAADMESIVPIHNAVNERAWAEIKSWEAGWGAEKCGGPRLVSFAGDSKALTPRARWRSWAGYQPPFDRHDWVVDRCGKQIDYVIDFYAGKDDGSGRKAVSFFLDVRPKLNSWEGVKMRVLRTLGM